MFFWQDCLVVLNYIFDSNNPIYDTYSNHVDHLNPTTLHMAYVLAKHTSQSSNWGHLRTPMPHKRGGGVVWIKGWDLRSQVLRKKKKRTWPLLKNDIRFFEGEAEGPSRMRSQAWWNGSSIARGVLWGGPSVRILCIDQVYWFFIYLFCKLLWLLLCPP